MLRHFILPEDFDGNPADFYVERLVKVGFSRDEALDILGKASGAVSWYAAGGSEHLLAYLRKLYAGSWASTEGLAGVFSTKTGSMAGTPLGDLIFTFTISKVFRSIRARLAGSELVTYIDIEGSEKVFGIVPGLDCAKPIPGLNETSFVDDGAQPIIADAGKIVDCVRKVIAIIDSELFRFGLILNYTKGKTEALIVFRGKGSYENRVALLVEENGIMKFTNDQGVVITSALLINIRIWVLRLRLLALWGLLLIFDWGLWVRFLLKFVLR